MNQLDTAVTAAFVMEGMTCHRFGQMQEAWQIATQQGAVELVAEVMKYVPAIIALREVGEAAHGPQTGHPGSFQDEVSLPFGQWINCQVIDAGGVLPERKEAIDYLASLVRCSFAIAGQPDLDADEAIDAAAQELIAAK